MSWFTKVKTPLEIIGGKKQVPAGIWTKCDGCKETVYSNDLERAFNICPNCGFHHRLSSAKRIELLIDEGTFVEFDADLVTKDPLKFKDSKKYKDRVAAAQKKTGMKDSVLSGTGLLFGRPVSIAAQEFGFMGGSMGTVAGEKLVRTIERGGENKTPVIIVSCSGGARMQEGILSLMQMAKTASALGELAEKKLPFISILTDPTSGGVTASYAMLGDIIIAEPDALICFAGPRVIEQTIKETLPPGFQRSEFLLEHGFLDMVIRREQLKETISSILDYMAPMDSVDIAKTSDAGNDAPLNTGEENNLE